MTSFIYGKEPLASKDKGGMPSSMVLISVKKVLRFSISLYKSVLCAAHDCCQKLVEVT